jgi:hypothetical protein
MFFIACSMRNGCANTDRRKDSESKHEWRHEHCVRKCRGRKWHHADLTQHDRIRPSHKHLADMTRSDRQGKGKGSALHGDRAPGR